MKIFENPPRGIDPSAYSYLYRLATALNEQFPDIDKKLSDIREEISKLSGSSSGIPVEFINKLDGLSASVASLTKDMTSVKSKVSGLQLDLKLIEERVSDIDKTVGGMDDKLEVIIERLDALEGGGTA